jgi:hypothetical protein
MMVLKNLLRLSLRGITKPAWLDRLLTVDHVVANMSGVIQVAVMSVDVALGFSALYAADCPSGG